MTLKVITTACSLALAAMFGATPAYAQFSGNTIKIGTVRPESGPYSIYDTVTKGLEAYVGSINAKGGVKAGDGKTYKLELVKADDAYDPAKTPGEVQRLVEQEGIFAMVGQIGTSNNLAVRQYMNDNCVPSIGLATGSVEWGKAAEFPWFIGGLPSYATEGHAFMEYLIKNKPDAKIALPEVKLGLIPGAGGTQRGPRILGVEAALNLMVKGDPVPASAFKGSQLIDEFVEGDLLPAALAFAAAGTRVAGDGLAVAIVEKCRLQAVAVVAVAVGVELGIAGLVVAGREPAIAVLIDKKGIEEIAGVPVVSLLKVMRVN